MKRFICALLALSIVLSCTTIAAIAEEATPGESSTVIESIGNAKPVKESEQPSADIVAVSNTPPLTETLTEESAAGMAESSISEPVLNAENTTSETGENKIPVTFICSPQDLVLEVYYFNGSGKVYVEQDSDGAYHLHPNIYYYDAKQEGFDDVTEKSFEITEDSDELEIQITLNPDQIPDESSTSAPIENQNMLEENEIPVPVSTADSHLAEYISLMPAGSRLSVDYSDAPNLSGEVFAALQGTDKTLTLTNGNIQWSFYGEKVTSAKNVDLHVMAAPIENSESRNASQIQKLLNGQSALILTFADNGLLPGPAEITLKLTEDEQNALNSQNFNIYLYDEVNDQLSMTAENIPLTGDGLSFSITHNSDYVAVPAEPVEVNNAVFSVYSAPEQNPSASIKEMELLSVRANKDTVTAPDNFTLTAEIWTKKSAIESCNAHFYFHGKSLYYQLEKNPATGNYECTVPLGNYVVNGELSLDSIWVSDTEGNNRNFKSNAADGDRLPEQVSVQVINSHPELQDDLPPRLISVSAETTQITAPGTVKLVADIEEKVSGVKTAQAVLSPEGFENNYMETVYLNLYKDPESGLYTGEWDVLKHARSGVYHVNSLSLVDNADNRITYKESRLARPADSVLPNDITINISNKPENEDKLPPRLLSVNVDQKQITAPGSVKITAKLWDDASGIYKSSVQLFREDKKDDWRYNKSIALHRNSQTGLYEGVISFDEYTSDCVYVMRDVSVYDHFGRSSYYTIGEEPFAEEIKVTVENSNGTGADTEMPVLKSLSADQKTVNAPGSFQISAEVSDDASGVDFVSVSFKQQEESGISALLYQTENPSIYTGTCQVGVHKPNGIYSVSEVVVKDRAGHSAIYGGYYESLPNELNIEITNANSDMVDTQGPTLTSITADNTTVHAPGKVKIQADIQDDISGVRAATVSFSDPNKKYAVDTPITVYLEKNNLTDKFEGILEIGSLESSGKLQIIEVETIDYAGNISSYYRKGSAMGGQVLPNEPDITIVNPGIENADKDIPTLYNIYADKKRVSVPGNFTLSAEIGEDESGILSVTAWLSDIPGWIRTGTEVPIELKYNTITGKFEAQYDVPQNIEVRTIYLIQLDIRDQAGNVGSYFCKEYDVHGARNNCFHEVKVEIQKDTKAPMLNSVKAEKTEIDIPGTVKVIADITDDISGVKENGCSLQFSGNQEMGEPVSAPLTYNPESGKYEGMLSFEKGTLSQDISLSGAIVEDNSGNIRKYIGKNGTGKGDILPNNLILHLKNPNPAQNNLLVIHDPLLENQSGVWADGYYYPILQNGDMRYLDLPNEDFHSMVTYDYHIGNASDPHTQYPTGMHVWTLACNDGIYTAERQSELDNILIYAGSSIRITGKKGIRMITGIETSKREALIGGELAGFKLLEYGTALAWDTDLAAGNELVLGAPTTRSNYAYKRSVADPVFRYAGGQIQYTNVLVGFSNDDCKRDLAMRPYIILEDKDGKQVILYGGIVHRSIGYIAYQNRKAFSAGSAAYNYVWEIIHHVYGEQYDADYKK